ncbi:beta-ketoacyl synthase [Xylariaceae sp. FL1272]|nr:beta-ketoacyl synthase [Xylariaceae sp. FL1272]
MESTPEPIAVVGIACSFAGADTPSRFWELLKHPQDLSTRVPTSRFHIDDFYHPDPTYHGTTNVTQSYFLEQDVTKFDNNFFGFLPVESEAIDPQQRLLLELVYESISDAGLPMERLRGSATAVYGGMMCSDWDSMIARDSESAPTYAAPGAARSTASNRVSYFFDWHGPSMTTDTACSSFLSLFIMLFKPSALENLPSLLQLGPISSYVQTCTSRNPQAALICSTYRRAGLDLTKCKNRPQFFQAHSMIRPTQRRQSPGFESF